MKSSKDCIYPQRRRLKNGVVALLLAGLSLGSLGGASAAFAQDAPAEQAAPPAAPPAAPANSSPGSLATAIAVSSEVVTQASRSAQRQSREHARISGGNLTIAAYFVLWIFVFALIFLTMRRQRALNQELSELGRRMDVVFEDMK